MLIKVAFDKVGSPLPSLPSPPGEGRGEGEEERGEGGRERGEEGRGKRRGGGQ